MTWALERRAEALAARITPHLLGRGRRRALDIGCGTGHNALALERRIHLTIQGVDVVDMHIVGPEPLVLRLDQAGRFFLPFPEGSFDAGLILFVLQYAPDPLQLLIEARRVISGTLVVLQSTCRDGKARTLLSLRTAIQGRFAHSLARLAGLVSQPSGATLTPRRSFTRNSLETLFVEAGLEIVHRAPEPGAILGLSRDLYLLETRA